MDIVYKLTNLTRLELKTPPYYYIGSKTNCKFKGGVIYDKFNRPYFGSQKSKNFKNDMNNDHIFVEILFVKDEDDETSITYYECQEQRKINRDVWNKLFYNKSYADKTFTTNGYANFKYKDSNKLISLPIDHPDVISGKAIGQHNGIKRSDECKQRLKDRVHPSKNHDWSKILKGHKKKNKENYKKPKSQTHKRNIAKSKMKPITQYSLTMEKIMDYDSIDEASKSTGIKRNSISANLNGRTKTAKGYIWKLQVD